MLVLCVDDNTAHIYALGHVLSHAGYDVLQAHNCGEAFEIAVRQHPDIVLLDVYLPDATGFDLLTRLKKCAETRAAGVVMHSATAETREAKATAEQLGADAFLTFPIEHSDLLSVVRGVLTRRVNAPH